MFNLWTGILCAAAFTLSMSGAGGQDSLRVYAERNGLPNVFAKLRAGKPVNIVFFGGSITAGAGASQADQTSYRGRVGKWFEDTFPKSAVKNINSAIGGTGSDLGAFRTARDVLAKKPDLVFVEYAVNDGGTPDDMILRSMEGIVRQIRRDSRSTDICFIYTFVVGWLSDFQAGKLIRTVQLHEAIASHYGIPSINVAVPAASKLLAGTMNKEDFAKDGVHPTDAGYQIYTNTIVEFLDAQRRLAARAAAHPMPKALRPDSLEHARMIGPLEMGAPGKGWVVATDDPTHSFPKLLVSQTPGSEQTISFSGPMLAMFYVLGPDTGSFEYKIDQRPSQTLDPFDVFAKDYHRAHYRMLADDLGKGAHTVTFRIRSEHNADSKGGITRLGYLLVD